MATDNVVNPPESSPEPPDGPGEEDPLHVAFRSMRHAMTDGDDEAGANAMKKFISIHRPSADEEEGADEPDTEGDGAKPSLAMLLMRKKK